MKTTYDKEADAMYIYLKSGSKVYKTREIKNDLIVDFDENNGVIGIEILNASHYVSPQSIKEEHSA